MAILLLSCVALAIAFVSAFATSVPSVTSALATSAVFSVRMLQATDVHRTTSAALDAVLVLFLLTVLVRGCVRNWSVSFLLHIASHSSCFLADRQQRLLADLCMSRMTRRWTQIKLRPPPRRG